MVQWTVQQRTVQQWTVKQRMVRQWKTDQFIGITLKSTTIIICVATINGATMSICTDTKSHMYNVHPDSSTARGLRFYQWRSVYIYKIAQAKFEVWLPLSHVCERHTTQSTNRVAAFAELCRYGDSTVPRSCFHFQSHDKQEFLTEYTVLKLLVLLHRWKV